MITKKEYIKALRIVQEYELQLNRELSKETSSSVSIVDCPNCGSYAIDSTHNNEQHDCFDCGESWTN